MEIIRRKIMRFLFGSNIILASKPARLPTFEAVAVDLLRPGRKQSDTTEQSDQQNDEGQAFRMAFEPAANHPACSSSL